MQRKAQLLLSSLYTRGCSGHYSDSVATRDAREPSYYTLGLEGRANSRTAAGFNSFIIYTNDKIVSLDYSSGDMGRGTPSRSTTPLDDDFRESWSTYDVLQNIRDDLKHSQVTALKCNHKLQGCAADVVKALEKLIEAEFDTALYRIVGR